jgi:hypothetical protein
MNLNILPQNWSWSFNPILAASFLCEKNNWRAILGMGFHANIKTPTNADVLVLGEHDLVKIHLSPVIGLPGGEVAYVGNDSIV